MNLDALPQTLLIIMAEFSVGSLIAVLLADARGMVVASFVKLSALLVAAGAALTLLASFGASGSDPEGYHLRGGLYTPARVVFAAFLIGAIVYLIAAVREQRQLSLRIGGVVAGIGAAGVALLAYQISPPTWGFPGPLLSLVVGTLALGFVTEAMVLGHWYLVTPRLPSKPLEELTFVLVVVLIAQTLLLVLNVAVPARDVPESNAILAGSLSSNPAFWLRVGVGLAFPLALSFMAWQSSKERAMMSATGLLYIAVGAVFVGELLARGILFVTGAPV